MVAKTKVEMKLVLLESQPKGNDDCGGDRMSLIPYSLAKRFGMKLTASAAPRDGQSVIKLAAEREELWLSRRRKPDRWEQLPRSCQSKAQ